VIWLLWVFGPQVSLDGSARLLTALLIITITVWMMKRWFSRASATVAVLILGGFYHAGSASSGRRSVEKSGTLGLTWENVYTGDLHALSEL
jgi:thiol:disulfide interchange protein